MGCTGSASTIFVKTLLRPIGTGPRKPSASSPRASARLDRSRRRRGPHVQARGRRFLFAEHLSVHEQGALRHPGGMLHGAIHVTLTPFVYLVIAPSLLLALGVAASEFLLHYHID